MEKRNILIKYKKKELKKIVSRIYIIISLRKFSAINKNNFKAYLSKSIPELLG